MEFSKRAIGKLIQAYDRVIQRNEKLWAVITEKDDENEKSETGSVDGKPVKKELGDEKKGVKNRLSGVWSSIVGLPGRVSLSLCGNI